MKDMVQDGLSQLGTSGDGTKIVYLTLALSVRPVNPHTHTQWLSFNYQGLEVTDISVLSTFSDIQRLELSQNCIKGKQLHNHTILCTSC